MTREKLEEIKDIAHNLSIVEKYLVKLNRMYAPNAVVHGYNNQGTNPLTGQPFTQNDRRSGFYGLTHTEMVEALVEIKKTYEKSILKMKI